MMSRSWEDKIGQKPWDAEDEGAFDEFVETEAESVHPNQIDLPDTIRETYLQPTKDTGTFYLIVAGVIAALGAAMLILFKGDDTDDKEKKKDKERVPKVVTRTVTRYVERKPEPPSKKKPKEKVIKEESEETEGDPVIE